MHILAGPGEIARTLPVADILEHGPLFHRPVVDRCDARRIEQIASRPPGECAEADRRIGRAKGGQTDLRDGAAGRARSEEHTSELQSLMRTSYAVFCLKKKKKKHANNKQKTAL